MTPSSPFTFPTGEARSINIGTNRKPVWALQGPEPTAADRQWAREVALGALEHVRGSRPLTNTERREISALFHAQDLPINLVLSPVV